MSLIAFSNLCRTRSKLACKLLVGLLQGVFKTQVMPPFLSVRSKMDYWTFSQSHIACAGLYSLFPKHLNLMPWPKLYHYLVKHLLALNSSMHTGPCASCWLLVYIISMTLLQSTLVLLRTRHNTFSASWMIPPLVLEPNVKLMFEET